MAPTHGGFFFSTIECPRSATPPASAEIICLEAEETLEPEPSAKSMSNLTSASGEASFSSETRSGCHAITVQQHQSSIRNSAVAGTSRQHSGNKRKRSLPGNPDPEAEVIALSPKTLMTTNRFVCEICGKGFQRDQNLQLHRRGHNLPWKLRQRTGKEVKKRVYVCPEQSCVHHDSSRALGDLTGIKKHFCRKHGEKKWKCDKCSKKYAVQSDWKAHSKTCGTREYRCDCGTLFSRRDSFITHRAFCDALAEESARISLFKSEGIQLPYTGQENNFGSPIAMSGASSRTSLAPSFRNIPNFLGMAMPPFDAAIPPPASRADHDASSTRHGASSADSFLVQLHSNSPTNLFAPCPRMSFLSGSEIGAQGTGLSGSYQMLQFNRLPQSDRLMEAKSQNTLPGNGFQEPTRGTQKQNVPNFGKQLQCQSSFSTSHASAQEKLMGSLFSSVGPSEGRGSKIQSPVQGQNFRCASGINMGAADLELSNTRQYQQRARASPAAGLYLSSPAGLVGSLVSKNAHETTNGLSISSMHHNLQTPRSQMSATALLQKAAQMGAIFSDSSRKHCLDFVESESIPNPLSLTSKISSCQGGDPTLIRNLDSSVHSIPTQKIKLPSELYPAMDAMDSTLETHAMSIGRSPSHVQGVQCMQQAASLRCHARTSSSLPFSLGISDNKSINENNVVQPVDRNLTGGSTSTAENITNGGEQMYGTVSCTRAPLPSLEGDTGRELIYERSTRDFLGVGGDTNGLRGIALEGNRTFLSQENTGISLDLSPSMNSLRNAESLNAWRLVGSRMGI